MRLEKVAEKIDLKQYPGFIKEHTDRISKIESYLETRGDRTDRMPRGCVYSQYRLALRKLDYAMSLFNSTKNEHVGKDLSQVTAEDCRVAVATIAKLKQVKDIA
jgi:hypothetical protein